MIRQLKLLQIFNILMNRFWSDFIITGCTVLVVALTTASAYATLTLHGVLPPLLYWIFPFCLVWNVSCTNIGIFGKLAEVSTTSESVKKRIRTIALVALCKMKSVEELASLKEIQALSRFGVKAGSTGYVTLSTQAGMMEGSMNYLILLLV
ncbi:unnamed protein product [Allacma fusca]|uniref:Uncharacterized protein n=1 Tax=Allacma fusca TaxID=39272 RepID=A0A8J2JFC9_9HEXA|nr:unnamed protein product [Allacma fusca]